MKTLFFVLLYVCCISFIQGLSRDDLLTRWRGIRDVEASSELSDSQGRYGAEHLLDATYRSWAEGARGSGIGESFTLGLHDNAREPVAGFALKNGYGDLNYFTKNNRVRSFKIYIDGSYLETIPVRDSIHFEQYAFKEPVKCKTIQFVIDSVYPGTTYNDTCVAEVVLLMNILEADDFYNNIITLAGGLDDPQPPYQEHREEGLERISDPDKIILLDYLPFNFSRYIETKTAVLNSPSTLKLTGDLPRLDGATALYPLYSAFVHAVYPDVPPVYDEETDWYISWWPYFPNPAVFDYYNSRYREFTRMEDEFQSIVQCNKTPEAYQRLIDGETDIIFCYEPSAGEIEAARAKGLDFTLTPIGKDAFVFIVNNKNIAENITERQIRDIYSGRVTNWKGISGADDVIVPYQRPENSGSQTIFQTIMGDAEPIRPMLHYTYIHGGMFSMIETVASDYYNYNSAIGYTFLFYLNQMAGNTGVKTLSVNGVPPSRQTIRNGTYPFSQTIYAVTTGNESEHTRQFIEWILSAQGQELVEKTSYIPILE